MLRLCEKRNIPTIVHIQMYIEGMSSFRAQTMDLINGALYAELGSISTRLTKLCSSDTKL
ncbi:hypothetical protein TELCIR_16207 [Teladorsagia circumcincta]|uniref:Uncharacterized protein n=1 Tax=Teladorsagia circumcincta TaxID=45464 RepID=A0A2G9TW89_TELCI|nr:hypothetical protein TELCIR_16207 [Teladorsagia circumcincta]